MGPRIRRRQAREGGAPDEGGEELARIRLGGQPGPGAWHGEPLVPSRVAGRRTHQGREGDLADALREPGPENASARRFRPAHVLVVGGSPARRPGGRRRRARDMGRRRSRRRLEPSCRDLGRDGSAHLPERQERTWHLRRRLADVQRPEVARSLELRQGAVRHVLRWTLRHRAAVRRPRGRAAHILCAAFGRSGTRAVEEGVGGGADGARVLFAR